MMDRKFRIKVVILAVLIAIQIYLYLKYGQVWHSNQLVSQADPMIVTLMVIFGGVGIGIVVAIISMIHGRALQRAGLSHEDYKKRWKKPLSPLQKGLIIGFVLLSVGYAVWAYFFMTFPNALNS